MVFEDASNDKDIPSTYINDLSLNQGTLLSKTCKSSHLDCHEEMQCLHQDAQAPNQVHLPWLVEPKSSYASQ